MVPQRTVESGYQYRFPTIAEACAEFAHLDYVDQDEDVWLSVILFVRGDSYQ